MACRLILLIGLPGSGKSTWAKHLSLLSPDDRIISTDRIRADLFDHEAVQGPWPLVWQAVQEQFQQTVIQIHQGKVRAGIYDATNVQRRQRRRVIALARRVGFTHLTGLWLDTALEVCLQRNQQRPRQVPEEVILKMARQVRGAPPDLDEGLDRVIQCGAGFPGDLPTDLLTTLLDQ